MAVEDNVYSSIPTEYSLEQNYPNPFNPSTAIRYSIPQEGHVSLRVYNLIGSEIATLINGYRDAGTYEVKFNATDLASGTYFYALTVNNFMSTKKMSIVK